VGQGWSYLVGDYFVASGGRVVSGLVFRGHKMNIHLDDERTGYLLVCQPRFRVGAKIRMGLNKMLGRRSGATNLKGGSGVANKGFDGTDSTVIDDMRVTGNGGIEEERKNWQQHFAPDHLLSSKRVFFLARATLECGMDAYRDMECCIICSDWGSEIADQKHLHRCLCQWLRPVSLSRVLEPCMNVKTELQAGT